LSKDTLLLSLNTIFHIYFSYRGFQLLESGIAHALFYTYPIFILLLAGARIDFMIFFAILGVIMITMDKKDTPDQLESDKSKQETEYFWNEGVIMILLAALSEALIYFLVRRIKTDNNWNHLFLSYSLGSILFTALYFKNIVNNTIVSNLSLSVIINIFIGLFGHLLRFFAISKLDPIVYAPLSYFGIVMAYIYGILFNQEKITIIKMMGTLCILISNYYYSVI
jgi:drug/metabolite transporter (DMT)-like permease